jgi:AraC-like DNA-binding protein
MKNTIKIFLFAICIFFTCGLSAQNKTLEAKSYDELWELYSETTDDSLKLNSANAYYAKAIQDNDSIQQLEGNFAVGVSYGVREEFKRALPYFEKAFLYSKTIKSKRVSLLFLLDWKAYTELKTGNFKTALETINTGFSAYKSNKNLKPLSSLVAMHATTSEVFYIKGDYKESLERINQGITLSNTLVERPQLKRLNTIKSLILLKSSYSNVGKGEYLESLKNLDSLSNTNVQDNETFWLKLYEINNLGVLKTNAEDYLEARNILKAGLLKTKDRKFEKGSDNEKRLENWVADLNGNISMTYLRESKPDAALYHLQEVEKRNSFRFDPCIEYNLKGLKAYAYIIKKDFNRAEKLINKAKIICDTITGRTASNAFLFGLLYNGRKEYKKAKEILYHAIPDYEINLKANVNFIEYYKYLAASYKGLNQLDSASVYLEKYIDIKELEEKKRFEVAGAFKLLNEASFNSELDAITEQKTQKETLLRYGGIGALVVFIIMGLALLLNYKKRKENQQKFDALFAKVTAAAKPEDIINTKDLELEAQTTAAVNEETTQQILKGLQKLEKENYFLHPGCNAHNVAKRIKTNTTYLSKVINSEFNKNFSTYINDLRINYAIIKLKQDTKFRKYTVSSIAKELGYKSADSFTKYFRKDTGLLPSFYIKKLNEVA